MDLQLDCPVLLLYSYLLCVNNFTLVYLGDKHGLFNVLHLP